MCFSFIDNRIVFRRFRIESRSFLTAVQFVAVYRTRTNRLSLSSSCVDLTLVNKGRTRLSIYFQYQQKNKGICKNSAQVLCLCYRTIQRSKMTNNQFVLQFQFKCKLFLIEFPKIHYFISTERFSNNSLQKHTKCFKTF